MTTNQPKPNRDENKRKYSCVYYSRDGQEYDGGEWEMSETSKAYTFRQVTVPPYDTRWKPLKCYKSKPSGHPIESHKEGSFTIYPGRYGIPFYFEPI
jgi:hypothetical protein